MTPYLLILIGTMCCLSQSFSVGDPVQVHLNEDESDKITFPIPGGTTFKFCPESRPDTDIFTIERIYWDPDPPSISRDQKLLVNGIFASPVPQNAVAIVDVHIPAWHNPESPARNYTYNGTICESCNYIYQTDDERGLHKMCDGAVGGNSSGPDTGPAVLVHEDFLFWPLPEGEYYVKLDVMMPDQENGTRGSRIFCVEGTENLDY